ncbi:hypothetical protein ACA910_006732 [Epithemia clementina (nom. ined.)]
MVYSFSEDPLDGASTSSWMNSDVDEAASVEESLSFGADSHSVAANRTPADEISVKACPLNPNYFNLPTDIADDKTGPDENNKSVTTNTVLPKALLSRRSSGISSYNLSSRLDLFDLPMPFLTQLSLFVLKLPPVDWRDLFCTSFNLQLISIPLTWSSFVDSFSKVSDPSLLQKFIECDIKDLATAFLCANRCGNIFLLHNLRLVPRSGSILLPTPYFMCLTRSPIDNNSPQLLDSDDLPSILQRVSLSGIPMAQEILNVCLQDSTQKRSPTPHFPLTS